MASRPEDPKTANESPDESDAPEGAATEPVGSDPDTEEGDRTGLHPAAENIIALFGGIRPMAHKLSIPVTTVQGWKKRGVIPEARHTDIMIAAEAHGIVIEPADLRAAAGSDEGDRLDGPSLADGTATAVEAEEVTAADVGQTAGDREATSQARDDGAPVAADASEDRSAAVAAVPVERRGGGVWLAALIAIVAAAAAITVPWWGPRYVPDLWQTADTAGLSDRIAAVEGQVGTAPTQAGPAQAVPDDVVARLEAIDERLAALEAAPAGADAGTAGAEGLADAMAGLEARLDALEAAGGSADPAAADAAAALAARVGELEAMVADVTEPPLGAEPERVAELADRVASLEQGLAGAGATADIAATLDPLVREVAQAQAAARALTDRVDAVDSRVAVAVDELAAALAAFDARLAGVETIGERVSRGLAAEQTLALAFGQLREQLDRQEPFAVAYATILNVVASDPDLVIVLEPLAGRAATGVPTRADLSGRFPDLANGILAAAAAVEDPDWVDTVMANVRGLVTVRRAPGLIAGDDPDAILARAEYHLENGALDAAVAEMETLDADLTEAGATWVGDARARMAAETALTALATAISDRLTTGSDAGGGAIQ